jgi:hypothetical protein
LREKIEIRIDGGRGKNQKKSRKRTGNGAEHLNGKKIKKEKKTQK